MFHTRNGFFVLRIATIRIRSIKKTLFGGVTIITAQLFWIRQEFSLIENNEVAKLS